MRQEYMIYKLYNSEKDQIVTEFFLPDETLKRFLARQLELASLRENGYKVIGILYVDKEGYLNARLTYWTEEYCVCDRNEQDTKSRFRQGELSYDVASKTLEMIQDLKWTYLKNINSCIRRLIREDFDIRNEVAIQLHDQYLRCTIG